MYEFGIVVATLAQTGAVGNGLTFEPRTPTTWSPATVTERLQVSGQSRGKRWLFWFCRLRLCKLD